LDTWSWISRPAQLRFHKAGGGATNPNKIQPAAVGDFPMIRGRNDPGPDRDVDGESKETTGVAGLPNLASPRKIAPLGSDLAWRTILGSVVDVEGVGDIGVARVLQEVWKRGAGDVVSVL
jgi:hypothetical protein